jgi:putative transport protein
MLAMDWIRAWSASSVAGGLAVFSLAISFGLALGAVRIRGLRLGVAGVLFSALLFGQLGLTLEGRVLNFLRDFALIIFVYSIGLQVGPGFVTSLRDEGLKLNVLSIAVVMLGAALSALVVRLGHLDKLYASGLYSGAFTSTPALAAGQEAVRQVHGTTPDRLSTAMGLTGTAYTVTYPLGVLGPILCIAMLRRMFRVRIDDEVANHAALEQKRRPPVERIDFEMTEAHYDGTAIRDLDLLRGSDVIFSRLLRSGSTSVPNGDTVAQLGDIYRAVGPRTALARIAKAMGRLTTMEVADTDGNVQRMDLLVTRTAVLRRSLRELNLIRRFGVTVVRVHRADIELPPRAGLRLQFGDRVTVVGPITGLKSAEAELGNCPERLNRPQLVPVFLGIVLGVLVGSVPLFVPGLKARLTIGLAGGPMIAAIALSQLGSIGSVIWYMPVAANQLFRDFGLAVFLACVGLKAGDHFVQNLHGSAGVVLIVWGLIITMLPVLCVGVLARVLFRMNFVTLSGWISGAMTSSPALLFAGDMTGSDAPALAYAAVAPLAMLAPIICAQVLVVILG